MQEESCRFVGREGRLPHMAKRARKKTYIKEWRQASKLTQERLAELADISQETVSRLESGKIGYTQETMEAIADALGTTVEKLVGRAPTHIDEVEATMDGFDEPTRRRAIAVLRALKEEPA
jgi:transcriptional regulator with XRE-family HTH domain